MDDLQTKAWKMMAEAITHGQITLENGEIRELLPNEILHAAQWIVTHGKKTLAVIPLPEEFRPKRTKK